jgi:hypothetical protein
MLDCTQNVSEPFASVRVAPMESVMTAPSPPWPLQTRLELAAQPTAPGVVRGHVRAVAYEWGLAGIADTAELLASDSLNLSICSIGSLIVLAGEGRWDSEVGGGACAAGDLG